MKKVMLGFAGEMGAGKGTAASLVQSWFPGTESFRFSDSLREFYAQFRRMHCAKSDDAAWLFFRDMLTEALTTTFGTETVMTASPDAVALFAQWLLGEFVPRHKGRWSKEASTPDLQDISTKVRECFGEDTLEKAIIAKMYRSTSESPYVVIEGIRRLVDIRRLLHDPQNMFRLYYVEADVLRRYEWHKKRDEKPGDADLTIAQFITLGEAEAEQQIRLLRPHAHVVLQNVGTREEFAQQLYVEVFKCQKS